jgi:tripartite-type tricarboxylate transporter receptor subunit TctC
VSDPSPCLRRCEALRQFPRLLLQCVILRGGYAKVPASRRWVAAAVPTKTPSEVVKRLAALFEQAGASAEVKDYHSRQSITLLMTGANEMRRYQIEEIARWKRLAATTGLELL